MQLPRIQRCHGALLLLPLLLSCRASSRLGHVRLVLLLRCLATLPPNRLVGALLLALRLSLAPPTACTTRRRW